MRPEHEIHDSAAADVVAKLGNTPGFVWEVTGHYFRDGFIVHGRASRAAHEHYCRLVDAEGAWFEDRIEVVDS